MTTPSSEAQSSSEYRLRSLQYTIHEPISHRKSRKGRAALGRPASGICTPHVPVPAPRGPSSPGKTHTPPPAAWSVPYEEPEPTHPAAGCTWGLGKPVGPKPPRADTKDGAPRVPADGAGPRRRGQARRRSNALSR
jgi:hypothetical protein